MSHAFRQLRQISFVLLLLGSARADAAALFDPVLRFRIMSTKHFVIYFHQGEEPLARRLAVIAEETWLKLTAPFDTPPPLLTHVVLVDQSDSANGFATPLPYNTIVMGATWPAGSELIGNLDDWLRLVFTHEFTHTIHLDRAKGWARLFRRAFGRTPLAFPNLYLPAWQIEGLATYEESEVAGAGRLHAGDFKAIVSEAARAGRLEPLGRVNGGLTAWPNGLAPYAYGVGFHAYLAQRFGANSLAKLADATSGRFPYTASRVFKRVYGESLGALWRDYQATLVSDSNPSPLQAAAPTRLTHHGYIVSGPRFDRHVCATCPQKLWYAARTPHDLPSLNVVTLDGSSPQRVTTRYLGTTTAVGRDAIYFDQQEIRRNTGRYSDLYALDRRSGRIRPLTSEARLLEPDLSPDERALIAVRNQLGRRDLVLVRLKAKEAGLKTRATSAIAQTSATRIVAQDFSPAIETLISEPETQFNAPRWSPDGRLIAVERHRPGALSEVVVVDPSTRAVNVVASRPHTRIVTPAWRSDGRAIVAAVAGENEPFNLYEFPVEGSDQLAALTHTTGGATWPDVSADGKMIAFVGYTVDGFDVFQIQYPATTLRLAPTVAQDTRSPELASTAPPSNSYSAWRTLAPRSWFPVIEVDGDQARVGAATSGTDVLRYHAYFVSATWLASGPDGAPNPSSSTPDWQVYYAYDRWRPSLWLSASTETSFFHDSNTSGTRREREIEAGVRLPFRRVRVSHAALASVAHTVAELTPSDEIGSHDRTALRTGWTTTSAHTHGYSISPERGATVGVAAETARRNLGGSADAQTFTGDLRLYLSGGALHHVAAFRLAAGMSNGDAALRRAFRLGGAGPNDSIIGFDRDDISLLRGFATGAFAGSRVALVNADYRWPLARPERGVGTWPLFFHTAHAALFVDAGQVWTRSFRARNLKTSVGAELSADLVAGYWFPLTATVGAARGHDGAGAIADRWSVYVRVGRAF